MGLFHFLGYHFEQHYVIQCASSFCYLTYSAIRYYLQEYGGENGKTCFYSIAMHVPVPPFMPSKEQYARSGRFVSASCGLGMCSHLQSDLWCSVLHISFDLFRFYVFSCHVHDSLCQKEGSNSYFGYVFDAMSVLFFATGADGFACLRCVIE